MSKKSQNCIALNGFTRLALLGAFVFLSSCTTSPSTTTESPSETTTISQNQSTTTVNPSEVNPASGEKEIACDVKAISENYGEKLKLEKCTTTWAMGDTDRDSWKCDKEGCPQTRLFQLQNGKWVNTATCQRNLPLTRYGSSCFVPNVGVATLNLIPPQDVACIIWPTNSLPRYAKETRCPLSRDAVLASLNQSCDDTFDITQLPVQKCDRGDVVRQVQMRLRELNFNIQASGFYGPDSARAILTFQEDKGLLPTAIVDEETWSALGLAE